MAAAAQLTTTHRAAAPLARRRRSALALLLWRYNSASAPAAGKHRRNAAFHQRRCAALRLAWRRSIGASAALSAAAARRIRRRFSRALARRGAGGTQHPARSSSTLARWRRWRKRSIWLRIFALGIGDSAPRISGVRAASPACQRIGSAASAALWHRRKAALAASAGVRGVTQLGGANSYAPAAGSVSRALWPQRWRRNGIKHQRRRCSLRRPYGAAAAAASNLAARRLVSYGGGGGICGARGINRLAPRKREAARHRRLNTGSGSCGIRRALRLGGIARLLASTSRRGGGAPVRLGGASAALAAALAALCGIITAAGAAPAAYLGCAWLHPHARKAGLRQAPAYGAGPRLASAHNVSWARCAAASAAAQAAVVAPSRQRSLRHALRRRMRRSLASVATSAPAALYRGAKAARRGATRGGGAGGGGNIIGSLADKCWRLACFGNALRIIASAALSTNSASAGGGGGANSAGSAASWPRRR